MKHIPVLLLKFLTSLIIFTIALDLFFEASIADILSFSVVLTVMSYLIGDRMLLPRVGKTNAIIGDFFLAYFIVWIFGSTLLHSYLQIAWGSIITASLVAFSEVFIHRFIETRDLVKINDSVKSKAVFDGKLAYGMEMAEEQDPRNKD
jgi:hypothetical protein